MSGARASTARMLPLLAALRRFLRCAGCARRGWPFCRTCLEASGATGTLWLQELGRIPLGFAAFDDAGSGKTPLAGALRRFKDRGDRHAGRALGECFSACAAASCAGCDAIVPVPSSGLHLAQRGFSPPLWIARQLGSRTGKPLVADGLCRDPTRPPQRGLGGAARRRNAHGAFRCGQADLRGVRVAVVDDLTTTGATLLDAARCLGEAGAEPVLLLAAVSADRERIERCREQCRRKTEIAGKHATQAM